MTHKDYESAVSAIKFCTNGNGEIVTNRHTFAGRYKIDKVNVEAIIDALNKAKEQSQ